MAIVLVACGFGYLVWPTPFRYDHLTTEGTIYPVRIHRFSGKTEMLYPSGWKVAKEERQATLHSLSADQLSRLDLRFVSSDRHRVSCYLYNGSDYAISELTIHLPVPWRGMEAFWDQRFQLSFQRIHEMIDEALAGPTQEDVKEWLRERIREDPTINPAIEPLQRGDRPDLMIPKTQYDAMDPRYRQWELAEEYSEKFDYPPESFFNLFPAFRKYTFEFSPVKPRTASEIKFHTAGEHLQDVEGRTCRIISARGRRE